MAPDLPWVHLVWANVKARKFVQHVPNSCTLHHRFNQTTLTAPFALPFSTYIRCSDSGKEKHRNRIIATTRYAHLFQAPVIDF